MSGHRKRSGANAGAATRRPRVVCSRSRPVAERNRRSDANRAAARNTAQTFEIGAAR